MAGREKPVIAVPRDGWRLLRRGLRLPFVSALILAAAMVSGATTAVAGSSAQVPCLPPTAPTSPGAQCALDIWGQVTYANGAPVGGASVSDGSGQTVNTDSTGYYDLYELEPGNYSVTATSTNPSCSTTDEVDDQATTVLAGDGTQADLQVPCSPSSPPPPTGLQWTSPALVTNGVPFNVSSVDPCPSGAADAGVSIGFTGGSEGNAWHVNSDGTWSDTWSIDNVPSGTWTIYADCYGANGGDPVAEYEIHSITVS